MDVYDEDGPGPLNVPGFGLVAAVGPGSASGWVYSEQLGEAIAREYCEVDDGGLWGLHALCPDRIPPPAIVIAWKRQFPAFGLLMREADKVRAERLVEQTIVIADTGQGPAPRIALQIAARQYMAEKLDGPRYGKSGQAPGAAVLPSNAQPLALDCSDETLAAIALAGQESKAPA
jgi:hypothetical protein